MITRTKRYRITFASSASSFDYQFSSDNTCLTIEDDSGTVSSYTGIVEPTFNFQNESCFGTATITLTATSDEGCTVIGTFQLDNECALSTTVSNPSGYEFEATPIGGDSPYTYTWFFDDTIFSQVSQNGASLVLSPLPGVPLPATTPIGVTVTDINGCTANFTLTYNFCVPAVYDSGAIMQCVPMKDDGTCIDIVAQATRVVLQADTCESTSIDWSTIQVVLPSNKLCWKPVLTPLGEYRDIFTFYALDGITDGSYSVTWTVSNNNGVRSEEATLTLLVDACSAVNDIILIDNSYELAPADLTPGTEILVDLEDGFVNPSGEADWSTFTFVAATGQVLVSASQLTATNGTAELDFDRNIKYTVGAKAENVDLVQFKISNTAGQVSNIAKWCYDFESVAAPTANNDAYTVSCNVADTLDILTNDTGDINPNSLVITQEPTEGSYTINTDGSLQYFTSGEGTDTIKYKISNPNGVQSAEATVTITIECAGNNAESTICPDSVVDLEALLGTFTAGGAWAQDPANPDTVSLASPTAVSFAAKAKGEFTFTYTIGSSVATVIINHSDYGVTILSVSAPFTDLAGNLAATVRFETRGVTDRNTIGVRVNHGATNDYYGADTWDGEVAVTTVLLTVGDGLHTIYVSADDVCGNKYTVTDVSITV